MSEDSFLTPRGAEGTGCAAVRRPPWIGAHRIKKPLSVWRRTGAEKEASKEMREIPARRV
nr:MAG TPA: hypothetical protein [Caudoviricetes sp.]